MTAGMIARELWWTSQEFSPSGIIISPWFSMLIYHLGITISPTVPAVQRHSLTPIGMIGQSIKRLRKCESVHRCGKAENPCSR
jgi:hypothetical protein